MASGKTTGVWSCILRGFFVAPSLVYALVQRVRAGLYGAGVLKTCKLPLPVISIGNITVGGTGKTPFTAHVARLLMSQGLKVAVLSRGYGGTREGQTAVVSDGRQIHLSAEECGDEPYLLARSIPGLVVVIGSDRYTAGLLALKECHPDVFLLDDGFQHLRLHRDLNILLMDCTRPFGNGWTLPAGLLRETKRAAERADLVVLTRCPEGGQPRSPVPVKPHFCSRHDLNDLVPLAGGEPLSFAELRGRSVVAFSGIAEPQIFIDGLKKQGLNVNSFHCFPDHAVYDEARLDEVKGLLDTAGAEFAITTEKDGVKLGRLPARYAQRILLARLSLGIADPAPLASSLLNLLQK
ncbi:MAG: tetraacyldisaccharide 4'-kinase [Geobacteraceae bacterium]|nr:tetraacyldisaccharide 4'-kinase [Geobacteraceae bacterium]